MLLRAVCGLTALLTLTVSVGDVAEAQTAVADPAADMSVASAAYARDRGPVVGVDAAHNNYHTIEGRYGPFAEVLRNDGYRVVSVTARPDKRSLRDLRVLVVANALAASNLRSWSPPNPSALDPTEIAAIRDWVRGGGALFLIADHMPFAGAASDLASAFGFHFDNVYAVKGDGHEPELFSRDNGSLASNAITDGDGRSPPVTQVETFLGSSFRAPPGALPLMSLDGSWSLLSPTVAGKFDTTTPSRVATPEDLRAAALQFGRGRVVVVSEAALFTNQLVKGAPYGFGRPSAQQDKQLLLNIVEWLDGSRRH